MAEGRGVQQADGSLAHEPLMELKHAADEIVHIVELPLSVNSESCFHWSESITEAA